jgi:hypothetical protein
VKKYTHYTYSEIKDKLVKAFNYATDLQKELVGENELQKTCTELTLKCLTEYEAEIDAALKPALTKLTPKQLEVLMECLRPSTMQAFTKLNMAMLPVTMKITTANLEKLMERDNLEKLVLAEV